MTLDLATQLLGLMSFGIAALLCYVAWRALKDATCIWGFLVFIYATLTLDVALEIRHTLSSTLREILKSSEIYHERGDVQALLIWVIALIALLVIGWAIAFRLRISRVEKTALFASFFLALVFLIEIISLHEVDAVFYRPLGPVYLIGWVWMGFAALTCCCALVTSGREMSRRT